MQADKPKVLVVDDEHVIADTLAIILNQHGFEASAAHNGIGAVEQAYSLRPDVIICDVIMPDMSGFDAAILIRKFLPDCKIIHFSGQAAVADLLEGYCARGHEFEILAKPVHPQDLIAWLRENSKSTIRKLNLESAVEVLAELEVLKERIRIESAAMPVAVPAPPPGSVVEPIPVRIEAEAQASAKAVRIIPAKAKPTLIGAFIGFLLKFACFVLVLMAVFAALAFIGYGIDNAIVWTRMHVVKQPEQHYTEPKPGPVPEPHKRDNLMKIQLTNSSCD